MLSSMSFIIRSTRPTILTVKLVNIELFGKIISIRNLSDKVKNQSWNDLESDDKRLAKIEFGQIFAKEFPNHYSDGKFISRISYVEFIDQALDKLKELGLEKDIDAYKELLKVFPEGKYCPNSIWDIGLHHAPQQLCAVRLLSQMELYGIRLDKEVERLVIKAFSKNSAVWQKVARMNYWSMKGRNVDPHPLPEKISDKPHDMAKVAIVRMLEDKKSVVTVTNTSSLPDSVDKTWVVFAQSPTQQSILDKLDEKKILYLEESGLAYTQNKYLSYFVLKAYDDEETRIERAKKPEPDFNYNTVKVKFYGKPIKEKMAEFEMMHHVGDGYVLAIGMTGTSSHDSVLSWLKILQKRNPKLNNMSVVFKLKRPTMDIVDSSSEQTAEGERTTNR